MLSDVDFITRLDFMGLLQQKRKYKCRKKKKKIELMKKLWLKKGPQEMGMMQEGVVSKVRQMPEHTFA